MSETILIVEDDPTQIRMLGTLIRKNLGYEAAQALNGAEGIDYLKDNHKPYEGRIGFFVMPEDRSIDINNNLDLKVCRMLISENDV